MPKLKIDSSLHDPIEIEINGVVYTARRLTRKALQDIDALDKKVGGGDVQASYERLVFMLPDAKMKVIEELDLVDVGKITMFIIQNAFKAKGDEKNAPAPGDEKSPS